MSTLTTAHAILGDLEAAKSQARKLEAYVAEEEEPHLTHMLDALYAWAWVDPDYAVSLLSQYLDENSKVDLVNSLAFDYYISHPILSYPEVKDVIVKDGRWLDYLSTRVPEYAGLKNTAQ